MTTFSFSTGNPSNLTGGATASMTDISGSLTDVKTFLNGGNITDTNVTAAGLTDASLTSPNNVLWRTVEPLDYRGGIVGLSTTPCYVGGTAIIASGSAGSAISGLWVPTTSELAVAGKTARLRVVAQWATNATAPGITFTWGLYPITGVAGGINALTVTLGTVVTGSTASVASPAANGASVATGASFDASLIVSGNPYTIGVVGSGAQAGNSLMGCTALLQMRHT